MTSSAFDSANPVLRWTYAFINPLLNKGAVANDAARDANRARRAAKAAAADGSNPALVKDLQSKADEAFQLAERLALDDKDLDVLPASAQVNEIANRLEEQWKASGGSLLLALISTFPFEFGISGFFCFLESVTRISQPVLMGSVLTYMKAVAATAAVPVNSTVTSNQTVADASTSLSSSDPAVGFLFGALLVLVALAQIPVHHVLYHYTMTMGWKSRMALTALVHRKLLKAHSASLASEASGKIINLVSADMGKFDKFFPRLHFGWAAPIDFLVVGILMIQRVGLLAAAAGIGIVFITMPVQIYLGGRFASQRRITAGWQDKRVRMIREVFAGILTVKSAGWEKGLGREVGNLRQNEEGSILTSMTMKSFGYTLSFSIPYISSAMTIGVFWATGGSLDVANIFSTIALIHVLKVSMGKSLVNFIEAFPEFLIAISRLQSFLELREREPKLDTLSKSARGIVATGPASFTWDSSVSSVAAISGIDFKVTPGEICIVKGATGSGKTTLLSAIMGELDRLEGNISVSGKVAYMGQRPWIRAATVRDNIVWNEDFDDAWYRTVVDACSLLSDFETLPNGDETLVGDRGLNLSGGQKARISLARLVYSKPEVALLDDPLSAVDPKVSTALFSNAIRGLLRKSNTAVVLVTHNVNYFTSCDTLITMASSAHGVCRMASVENPTNDCAAGNEGEVEQKGEEVPQTTTASVTPASVDAVVVAVDGNAKKAEKKSAPQGHKEEKEMGEVSWQTYSRYFKAGGMLSSALVLFLFVSSQTVAVSTDIWLKGWAETTDQSSTSYFYVFLGLTGVVIVLGAIRAVFFFRVALSASTTLHKAAYSRVVGSPMSFFGRPLGQILNKFSSDMSNIDEVLPIVACDCANSFFLCVASAIVAVITLCLTSIAAAAIVVCVLAGLTLALVRVRAHFLSSSRELKRMEAITKSPIFGRFGENLAGVQVVRAFGCEDEENANFEKLIACNGRAWWNWLLVNRWVGFRLDSISTALLALVVFLGVAFAAYGAAVDVGMLGVALTYVIQLSGMFQYMIRLSAQVEVMMTSAERISYYASELEQEEEQELKEEAPRVDVPSAAVVQNADGATWKPSEGAIVAKNLSVRYGKGQLPVLRNVSFAIKGGSKVGIIGRTGSGKSSLVLALLRLNEICGGSLEIDGQDTFGVPLDQLRPSVAFIPQQADLFTGSLRFNLDPMSKHTDAQLWEALRAARFSEAVKSSKDGLDMEIREGGANLSAGQRQCVSMARATLAACEICVLDEATANIDYETDSAVQDMLRSHPSFVGKTLVVIAHRIATIEDSDIIVVLDQGEVAEIGTPQDLLKKADGLFSKMVKAKEREEESTGQ